MRPYVKVFQANEAADLEKQVNEWFGAQSDFIKVTHVVQGVCPNVYILTVFYNLPTAND